MALLSGAGTDPIHTDLRNGRLHLLPEELGNTYFRIL
jgi:hypothetical protein